MIIDFLTFRVFVDGHERDRGEYDGDIFHFSVQLDRCTIDVLFLHTFKAFPAIFKFRSNYFYCNAQIFIIEA